MKTLIAVAVTAVAVLLLSCGISFAAGGEKLAAKERIETIPGRSVQMVIKSERDKVTLISEKNYLGNTPAIIILPPKDGFKDGGTVGIAPVNKYVKDPVKGIALPKDLLKDAKRPGQKIVKNISLDKDHKQPGKIDDGLIDGTKPPYNILPPRDEFGSDMVGKAPGNIDVKDPIRSITPPTDLINGPKKPYQAGSTLVAVFEITETPAVVTNPTEQNNPPRPDPREQTRHRIPGIGSGATIRGITEVITRRIGDEESIIG